MTCLVTSSPVGALAATVSDIEPEIVASSWSDETNRFAAVTFNGKELFRFKTASEKIGEVAIEDKAEDLAAKLDQLVKSKKFNPDKLYPVKTKDGVILKTDGIDLLKFSNSDLANSTILGQTTFIDARELDPKSLDAKSLEYGLKLTNVIRTAFGVKALQDHLSNWLSLQLVIALMIWQPLLKLLDISVAMLLGMVHIFMDVKLQMDIYLTKMA